MFKNVLILIILFNLASFLFAEESEARISPEQQIKDLMQDAGKTEQQLRDDYIEAAEIKQLTGDLKNAADLFKKASLIVKGQKDFLSLYRSAVLNTEMAFLREAEADIRAILTFSDDEQLRIRAMVLSARIHKQKEENEEAESILKNIFLTSDYIPNEAFYFASGIFSNQDFSQLCAQASAEAPSEDLFQIKSMVIPETVFGNFNNDSQIPFGVLKNSSTEIEKQTERELSVVSIQLGSFSVQDNAEELKKAIDKKGYESIVKTKLVNEKEYFTVVVPLSEGQAVQQMIIELKENGYEGYPVY